jgi:hypothetical protein
MTGGEDAREYFPPPESLGGWRWLKGPEEVRSIGGFDPERLQLACERNAQFTDTSQVVIVRHGYLVAEWNENHASASTRFDIWSATKSFTSTAFGILFDQAQRNEGALVDRFGLDTPAYSLIPEGYPLSDPRKEGITLRHLLTMTSGMPGVKSGINAIPTDAFSAWGYLMNSCYVVPSLDLVVVRLGTGPAEWDERVFIERVVEATT